MGESNPRRPGRVLHPGAGADLFVADRVPVEGPLADVASHLWCVRWDRPLRTPWTAQILSDPAVHLTVEESGPVSTATRRPPPLHGHAMPAALVHGPVTRLWTVELPLRGRTSGVAFRPGGFAALFDLDVSSVAGRVVRAEELLPGADPHRPVLELQQAVLAEPEEDRRRRILLDWLGEVHRAAGDRIAGDPAYRTVTAAVALMEQREQVRVEQVAAAVHCSPRTLQRWFLRYVGVPPLQVLRRRRLQDATAALDAGEEDLARLAAELGWADHAHFTRDFRAVVGVPPEAYRRGVGAGRQPTG